MATVAQTPAALNAINRGGKWILNQVPTTGTVETRLAWELEVEGTKVAEDTTLTTSGSDNVVVDPRNALRGWLLAGVPGLVSQSVWNVTDELIAAVTLKHGTVVIDWTNEPVTKVVNIAGSSGPFDFINSVLSQVDGEILTSTAAAWLSHTPDEVFTHPFAYSWIGLYGNDTITCNWVKCDGTTGSFIMSAPFDANAIPCGPVNLGLDPDVKYYTLTFATMSRVIEFHVECNAKEDRVGNIIFQEPTGGMAGHALTDITQGGGASSSLVEYHSEPDGDFDDWSKYGGKTVARKTAGATVSGSIRVKPSPMYRNFVANMIGSPIAWIQSKDLSGSVIFIKANIVSAGISNAGTDGFATLTISATVLQETKSQGAY